MAEADPGLVALERLNDQLAAHIGQYQGDAEAMTGFGRLLVRNLAVVFSIGWEKASRPLFLRLVDHTLRQDIEEICTELARLGVAVEPSPKS